jgi:hypothetical protein
MQTLRASCRPIGAAAPAAAISYRYYGIARAGPI